ncbi:hypothetical protein CUMW_248000 [Citrus unshiu]|uniref:Cytochrome P450 n=1 Tax=Citrus unshiu TaxID=55188 RepID=A0A2H5QP25_CITUN|nr:hypothetical protein CUMW_248000 [Citrus unshiu]
MSGKFVVSDALPFLRWLDIGCDERSMKKIARESDIVVQGWLEEHKSKRDSQEMKKEEEDFMNVMLSILGDAEQYAGRDVDRINKAICLALILAATDTTTVILTWVISLLLNHRDILNKAQNELDIQVGTKKQVNESDIKKLVYLQAILKEAKRLYPAVPLLVPHESMEECTVNGYHVPAGTQLLINLWKLHRDPRVWEEPCKFQPKRFLTRHKDIDVKGQNFELLPFSSGRRMCPGVSFALQIMQLTLASLLHGFDIAIPSNELLDMQEGLGLTLEKSTPLEVLVAPRLSASLAFALQVMQFTLASLLHGFDFATLSNELLEMGEGLGLAVVKSTPLDVLVAPRLPAFLYRQIDSRCNQSNRFLKQELMYFVC